MMDWNNGFFTHMLMFDSVNFHNCPCSLNHVLHKSLKNIFFVESYCYSDKHMHQTQEFLAFAA